MARSDRGAPAFPTLGRQDALPGGPQRILVAGVSGSGKTTLAARIAAQLGIEHTELDGLYHGPRWQPRAEFVEEVTALADRRHWVTEWLYRPARPLLAARADLLVWLDLPIARSLAQVARRTLRRRLRREVLWNGNIEPPLYTLFTDREHVLRWAWTTRHKYPSLLARVAAERPELPIVRLRSHAAADAWLAGPLSAAASERPEPDTPDHRPPPAAAPQEPTPPAG